jgi:hypothetical protein
MSILLSVSAAATITGEYTCMCARNTFCAEKPSRITHVTTQADQNHCAYGLLRWIQIFRLMIMGLYLDFTYSRRELRGPNDN